MYGSNKQGDDSSDNNNDDDNDNNSSSSYETDEEDDDDHDADAHVHVDHDGESSSSPDEDDDQTFRDEPKNPNNAADSSDDDDDDSDGGPNDEWERINVYPPGQTNDGERGRGGAYNNNGPTTRPANYDAAPSEEEIEKRRTIIIVMTACCCVLFIVSIVLGALAFTMDDHDAKRPLPILVPKTIAPQKPIITAAPQSPSTNAPSTSPAPQTKFVYNALSSTFVQKGTMVPQSASETLLVQNGNGVNSFDSYALVELDVSSKNDNIFRRWRKETSPTRSYLRLFLAAEPSSPPPKLTLSKIPPSLDLKFLTFQEFDVLLAEPLKTFRISDLDNPLLTGTSKLGQNVFLPVPKAGQPIWIDITDAVKKATTLGETSMVLMLQNRDAVEAPGTGTQFRALNSDDPPALVVLVDDSMPTLPTAPSMSMAPSSNPSGSIYPTSSHTPTIQASLVPSSEPSLSTEPTIKPSISNAPSTMASGFPSSTPSSSAKPSVSVSPSAVPSRSSAPSASAKPSSVPSNVPTELASEFPTNSHCLPCPEGQLLKFSTTTIAGLSETCADLRLRLLFSKFALFDASPAECAAIVDTCGCEAPVACTPCAQDGQAFESSADALVNGVTCQVAQITLAAQKYAYSQEQCTALQSTCTCAVPASVCKICPQDQAVSDPGFVLSTSSLGLISCGDLEVSGLAGYLDAQTCATLESADVSGLCRCGVASVSPSPVSG